MHTLLSLLLLSSTAPKSSISRHTLSILTLPDTTPSLIANEAILTTAIKQTTAEGKLSLILRNPLSSPRSPTLPKLRSYVSTLYSAAWDLNPDLNIIIYPQNLPNTASETWVSRSPDLECVVSHDDILGWFSRGIGTGGQYDGRGGLDAHVEAINVDRASRDLNTVRAINVDPWPVGASYNPDFEFLEDDNLISEGNLQGFEDSNNGDSGEGTLLGGTRVSDELLYECVAVGGTFDGLHNGHRKLLTLAISSVEPLTGRLLVGVTCDDMLREKELSGLINPSADRIAKVKQFLGDLAPGMKNRMSVKVINDKYGPPAWDERFDALVLSHETLETGMKLNDVRESKGLKKMKLLCTRRTEIIGMSSTAIRRKKNLEAKKIEF